MRGRRGCKMRRGYECSRSNYPTGPSVAQHPRGEAATRRGARPAPRTNGAPRPTPRETNLPGNRDQSARPGGRRPAMAPKKQVRARRVTRQLQGREADGQQRLTHANPLTQARPGRHRRSPLGARCRWRAVPKHVQGGLRCHEGGPPRNNPPPTTTNPQPA